MQGRRDLDIRWDEDSKMLGFGNMEIRGDHQRDSLSGVVEVDVRNQTESD